MRLRILVLILVLLVAMLAALTAADQASVQTYLSALGITGQTLSEALNTFPDEIDEIGRASCRERV